MMRLFIIFILIIAFSNAARADDQAPQHKVSILISPFHLIGDPVLQITDEWRLAKKIGGAVILGGGQVSDTNNKSRNAWEVGGQFRYYLLGSFIHGMILGTEVGYLHVSGNYFPMDNYYIGARAGIFIGYKIAFKFGFTLDLGWGPEYVYHNANNTELQTLINLKVGWSF
jgi:hypothetical protein